MCQRREPELWFTSSFRCYSFESCCHGWRFFSLHRRPNPPFVWSPCFPRTIQLPLAASPCSRLSRPQSTISQSDCHQVIRSPLPCGLVGPYKLRLNPVALPCSHTNPWTACRRYEPRKHPRALAITHPGILPSPLEDKVGCSYHDRFRGYVSVH